MLWLSHNSLRYEKILEMLPKASTETTVMLNSSNVTFKTIVFKEVNILQKGLFFFIKCFQVKSPLKSLQLRYNKIYNTF